MSKAERKLVYSVTLHERVAVELRRLDSAGKLSRGVARAQELLALPNVLEYALAVESGRISQFYARLQRDLERNAVIPPDQRVSPPVLPGGVIPPSVVLPTDNPFEDDSGDARGPQGAPPNPAQPGPTRSAPPDPGPMTDQERTEIAALEEEARGSSEGPIASAKEPESTPEPGADIAEPRF